MIIYCLSYAHDIIMIWISRSLDLHSDNIITTTTIVSVAVGLDTNLTHTEVARASLNEQLRDKLKRIIFL